MREDHHFFEDGRQSHTTDLVDMRAPSDMSPNELQEFYEDRETKWSRRNEEKIATAVAYLASCSPAEYAEVIERLHHSKIHQVSIALPCTHIGRQVMNSLELESANYNGPFVDIWLKLDGEKFTMEVE